MSFKEFGNVIEPAKQKGEFKEFGERVEPMSRPRSLVNAFAAGATERAGDIAGFVQSLAPSFLPRGPLTKEKAHKFSEEKFPHFEKEPEKIIKRGGGVATEALLSPGGLAAKAIQVPAGALLGYAAEKFNFPEWAQSIAEGIPFFFSGGKKIPLKPDQKKLGEFLRKQGLTENEITPLLKTPEQINRWAAFASKGKKSRELMESIYQKSGKLYDTIIEKGKSLIPIPEQNKLKVLKDLHNVFNDLPDKYRKLIGQDLKDLITKGRAGVEDLINFYRDINAVIGAEKGGKAYIGNFKKPIMEAFESISPELASDFQLTNQLYGTRARVASAIVNPKDFDKFLDIGEVYGLGAGLYNRDLGMLVKVLGAAGGRAAAREMLINPRLQNLSMRIGESLKKNKLNLVTKYTREFSNIVRNDDPDLADAIDATMTKS